MYQSSFSGSVKHGFTGLPSALRFVIALNAAIFVLQLLVSAFFGDYLTLMFSFVPEWKTALFQPWRIVSYMFLHSTGNLFHFLFNMLWLWWMGKPVEQALGPRTFLAIYLGSGIFGAFVDLILAQFFSINMVIGASGAVFGMMVAFAMIFPRMPIMLFLLPPIEARFVVAGLIAMEILLVGNQDGVARVVHLGGALGGYLLMKAHNSGVDLAAYIRMVEYGLNKLKSSNKPKKKANSHIRHVDIRDAKIIEEIEETDLDAILEKISKNGYEGLTDEEKRKLFEISKRN